MIDKNKMSRYWNDTLYLQENELAHYGVLGMKWGVRRYQNADGSLTEAGLRRQQKTDARAAKKAAKKEFKANVKSAKKDLKDYKRSNSSKKYSNFKKVHGYTTSEAELIGPKKLEKIKQKYKSAADRKKAIDRTAQITVGKYLAITAAAYYIALNPKAGVKIINKGLKVAAKGVQKAIQGSIDTAYLIKKGMDKIAPIIKEAKIKANPDIIDVDASAVTNALGKIKMASLY